MASIDSIVLYLLLLALLLFLPVGVPSLFIGIISLIFRRRSGSIAGCGLIFLMLVACSIGLTVATGIIGSGWFESLIFSVKVLFFTAIPGFLMALMARTERE